MQGLSLDVEAASEEVALVQCGRGSGTDGREQIQAASIPRIFNVRRAVLATGLICGIFVVGVCSSSPANPGDVITTSGGINHAQELYDETTSALASDAYGLPGMPSAAHAGSASSGSSSSSASSTPTSINNLVTGDAECGKKEELLLGVCYMNCSLLTQGRFPIRSGPNICCNAQPCLTPSQIDTNGVFPGSGWIVGGGGPGSYPHPPGGCAGNEESHLGMCYKKCSLLTNNEFPKRVMANTCCKASPCWNPFNLKTSGTGACTGFGIGGGLSDDAKCPHKPA